MNCSYLQQITDLDIDASRHRTKTPANSIVILAAGEGIPQTPSVEIAAHARIDTPRIRLVEQRPAVPDIIASKRLVYLLHLCHVRTSVSVFPLHFVRVIDPSHQVLVSCGFL